MARTARLASLDWHDSILTEWQAVVRMAGDLQDEFAVAEHSYYICPCDGPAPQAANHEGLRTEPWSFLQ